MKAETSGRDYSVEGRVPQRSCRGQARILGGRNGGWSKNLDQARSGGPPARHQVERGQSPTTIGPPLPPPAPRAPPPVQTERWSSWPLRPPNSSALTPSFSSSVT